MRFVMAERGSVFSTQDRAVRLFAELQLAEAAQPADEELVIDFSDVRHVGDSLASAFIGRLFAERRESDRPEPKLVEMSDAVERAVERALKGGEMPLGALSLA